MRYLSRPLLAFVSVSIFCATSTAFFPQILSQPRQLWLRLQHPMNVPLPIPGTSNSPNFQPSAGSGDLALSDVIGKERRINIFAGFTRDIDSISQRLSDPEKKTIVLAPVNSALQKLPRKPWEDPEDYNAFGTEAYSGNEGEDRATRNLRRFVEAHVLPVEKWEEGQKVQSLRGETVWWETNYGKKIIYPGGIEILGIVERVGNGEVLQLDSCLNYEV